MYIYTGNIKFIDTLCETGQKRLAFLSVSKARTHWFTFPDNVHARILSVYVHDVCLE